VRDEKLNDRGCREKYPEEATEPQPAQSAKRSKIGLFGEPCAEEDEETNLAQLADGGKLSLSSLPRPWCEPFRNFRRYSRPYFHGILLVTFPRAKTST
jgi:hypothetical protein